MKRYLWIVLYCLYATICSQCYLHGGQIWYSEKFCNFLARLDGEGIQLIPDEILIATKEGRKTIYKLCKTPTSVIAKDNVILIRVIAKILQQLNGQAVCSTVEKNSWLSLFSVLLAGYVVYYEKFGDNCECMRNREHLIRSEMAKIEEI
jgi:hypothetical protein